MEPRTSEVGNGRDTIGLVRFTAEVFGTLEVCKRSGVE